MSALISKNFLGTDADFVIENEMGKWSNDASGVEYVIGDPKSALSVDQLLSLYGIEIPSVATDRFRTAMNVVGSQAPPWQKIIPRKEYISRFRDLVSKAQSAVSVLQGNEYSSFFLKSNSVFSSLVPSHVDVAALDSYLAEQDVAALRSVKRLLSGSVLPAPNYNRVKTKTGRLTIVEGPQILTLKKEFRSVFKSSFEGGSLYEIDFVSLEPRVALNLAKGDDSQDDVYKCFVDTHDLQITRDTAKLAVLCALYGAGTSKLTRVLKQDNSKVTARQLLSKISAFFGVNDLTDVLKSQSKSGYITNYFGRPIEIDDNRGSILVNNFLQSTASDLAIHAFSSFSEDKKFPALPVFIIHDALVVDVMPGNEVALEDYLKDGFTHEKLGRFPLKLKRLQ